MKIITITLNEPNAHLLIKLLTQEPKAAAIIKDLQAALCKDRTAKINKQLLG